MTTTTTYAIFWGNTWVTNPGDKIAGIDAWYTGYGETLFAQTQNEYAGLNGQVTATSVYKGEEQHGEKCHALSSHSFTPPKGHFVDTSTVTGSTAKDIVREVCKVIAANGLAVDATSYFGVYLDVPRCDSVTKTCANYCAWHSGGTCSSGTTGAVFQFGFFWNLDDDAGCDPNDDPTVTGHSQGLAALANLSGHELGEARTSPGSFGAGAWYIVQGSDSVEVGDKCAWMFPQPFVTFKDGTKWKQHAMWSNNAYIQTGNGCITSV